MQMAEVPNFRDLALDQDRQQLADKIQDLVLDLVSERHNVLICVEQAGKAAATSTVARCREIDPNFDPMPQSIIIGKQAVGKSRLIETIAGEALNFISGTLGSRRPRVLEFRNIKAEPSGWYVRNRRRTSLRDCRSPWLRSPSALRTRSWERMSRRAHLRKRPIA